MIARNKIGYNFNIIIEILNKTMNEENMNDSFKKVNNQYKVLYRLSKEKRKIEESRKRESIHKNRFNSSSKYENKRKNQNVNDSLEGFREDVEGKAVYKKCHQRKKCQIQSASVGKKRTHNRSQSCPFVAASLQNNSGKKMQKPGVVQYKKLEQGQSRRTLKKKSTQYYLKHQHRTQAAKPSYKNSNSHLSQKSNTILVQTLPIEQLSSMLYSSNNLQKKTMNDSQAKLAKQIFSIHNDIYFKTRLNQQIKMYDLSQQMQELQTETANVRIKQEVLEKLASQFEMHRITEDQSFDHEYDESLLIHH